jgi:hypothetical protein
MNDIANNTIKMTGGKHQPPLPTERLRWRLL